MSSLLLPSTKSVQQRALDLLALAGIRLDREDSKGDRNVSLKGIRWPSTAAFAHQSRIPGLVASGQYTLGLVGLDSVRESGADVKICADLLFNRSTWEKARVVLVTGEDGLTDASSVPNGAEVLTEYPFLTRSFFRKLGRKVRVISSRGSIESEVPLPYPFGVCLTETGEGLRANRLRVIGTLMETSTVLIANRQECEYAQFQKDVLMFKTILLGVIAAREKVMLVANVPQDNLSAVLAVLPALTSPTVAPLANERYVSVSAVVPRSQLNDLQEQLLDCRAEGLIVTPLTSLIQSFCD
ncbi:ATP phosphoribosyltransferase [Candidatus Kaiserbacteria bacterium RIFCSPLOWO2_01_FULL_54_13]|uniref:ATP phosphoribosyltransferase n=1 Tax=Candidatus Kaiserbacteria bacterium RIFCSPLOWO2_01_FULL_54_13 TaxID=1798512 RepID=A0A1F6F3Z6_9BACT|nr:MAG: ATP phosphoribosyltransferase [Candidatus Kaiserbacteria bacterium RIFCSPLOWO2_01_FULL_54_13]